MSDYDFSEHKVDDVDVDVTVEYDGSICFQYSIPTWSGAIDEEIDVPFEELEKIYNMAKERFEAYREYQEKQQ